MKLTINNYFEQVGNYLDMINADTEFKATYNLINKATKKGADLTVFNESDTIRETFDLFLQNLNKVINAPKKTSAKKSALPASKSGRQTANKKAIEASPEAAPKPKQPKKLPASDAEKVEHIPSDIALVKRYISLHDKDKTYDQVLSVWRAFNKAIVERKVTKDSPYKAEIASMSSNLSSALEQAFAVGALHLVISAAKLKAYKAIAESVEKSPGVPILLEYINISGRPEMMERAEKLLKRIDRATGTGKLTGDRYLKEIKKARATVEAYINKETQVVVLTENALSGIGDIAIFGCPCEEGLKGFSKSQNAVVVKLIDEKVKNLTDCELDRAFADTVAPGICRAIATKLISSGQLNMALLRNPAKVRGGFSLNGSGKKARGYDFNAEVLDMRLKNAAKQQQVKATVKHKHTGLSGTDVSFVAADTEPEEVKIISARELVNHKFRTIGLTGRYRKLIGDPEPGFSAMIYGKPKSGKSTIAIDFAKDLTKLGKVLYCAFEEGHGYTLQDKVIRNKADVPGLDFADRLPSDFNTYRYVFIDSVSDAKLDEEAFGQLVKSNKAREISIIGIFHATKEGKFRGGQTFAHDVDVLIRVENGIAYAQGRYAPPNQISLSTKIPEIQHPQAA